MTPGAPPSGPSPTSTPHPAAAGYTPRLVTLRRVANWLNLSTLLGLVLAALSRSRLSHGPHGVIVARGRPLPFLAPRAMAVTVGDVVLLRASDDALRRHPALLDHEARHSTQWACWLGVLGFAPAYSVGALWSWWHAGDFALRNPFEMRAGLVDGGYVSAGRPRS